MSSVEAPAATASAAAGAPATTAASQAPPGTRPRWWVYVALSLGLVLMVGPFLWMTLSSFKSNTELLQTPPTWLPANATLANFGELFERLDFPRYFFNSASISAAVVASNLLFCSMLGYALAKLKFAGHRQLFAVIVATILVPLSVRMVPLFVLMSKMQLVNTLASVALPNAAWPLGVFLMRQFMLSVPDELLDAARVDGAGEFHIYWRIALPLVVPGLAVLAILTFMLSWNDLLWPLIALTDDSKYTLPVALTTFATGEHQTDHGLLMAGSLMIVLPVIAVFLVLQRRFTQTMATSGITS